MVEKESCLCRGGQEAERQCQERTNVLLIASSVTPSNVTSSHQAPLLTGSTISQQYLRLLTMPITQETLRTCQIQVIPQFSEFPPPCVLNHFINNNTLQTPLCWWCLSFLHKIPRKNLSYMIVIVICFILQKMTTVEF